MEVTLLYMTDDTETPQTYQAEEPFRMCFACDVSLPESLVLTTSNIDVNGHHQRSRRGEIHPASGLP